MMRELVLKNLMSKDKKRNELCMLESFESGGFCQKFEKRTVCRIVNIIQFSDEEEIREFLKSQVRSDLFPHSFIIHVVDTKQDKDEFIYKITGQQYIVVEQRVFILKTSYCFKRTVSKTDHPFGCKF